MSEQYTLTVKNIDQRDVYLIVTFEKPSNFSFKAGQYGVFKLLKPVEGRKVRAFSYVSAPSDKDLKIATFLRDPLSSFKTELKSLKVGEQVMMGGPMGIFQRDPSKPAVYIAGGIGITPFMSMMHSFKDVNQTLVFSSINGYLFKKEIESLSYLTTLFTGGVEKTQSTIQSAMKANEDALYYLVGSSQFVKGVEAFLQEEGVDKEDIITDLFSGY